MATFLNLDEITLGKAIELSTITDLICNGNYTRTESGTVIGDFVHDGKGTILATSNIPYLEDFKVLYLREHYEAEVEIIFDTNLKKWYVASITVAS